MPRFDGRGSLDQVSGARRAGIRPFGERLADLHDADRLATRNAGDLLHHLHGRAEPTGLRQARVPGRARGAPGDDAREDNLELLHLTRQPGDRVERLAHGVIAERTGTAHESRDLAIELGELRKTVNAVAEITEESHVSMIAFIDVYHKTL